MHTHKTLRKQKDKQNKAKTNKQTKNALRSFKKERNSGEVIVTYKTLPQSLGQSFQ